MTEKQNKYEGVRCYCGRFLDEDGDCEICQKIEWEIKQTDSRD